MKMTIVSKGMGQLTEFINNTDGQMQKVKSEIDKIKGEYQALGTGQKFAQEGKGDKDPLGEEKSDGEKKEDEEEKSPAEQGKADSEALQNGTLTDEQQSWELRSRLLDMSPYGAGLLPGGEPVSNAIGLGKDVLIGPEPVRDTPPNLSLPDTFPIQRQMAEALANAQYGDPSGLQPYVRDGDLIAPPQTGDRAYDDYQLAVKGYMGSLDPQGKTDDLINDYWTMYSAAVVGSYPQK